MMGALLHRAHIFHFMGIVHIGTPFGFSFLPARQRRRPKNQSVSIIIGKSLCFKSFAEILTGKARLFEHILCLQGDRAVRPHKAGDANATLLPGLSQLLPGVPQL